MAEIKRIGLATRYSDAVVFNGIAHFVEVPNSQDGDIVKQTKEVLENVEATLEKVGSDKSKLLQVTIYIVDMKDYDGLNSIWDPWLPQGHAPSRACIQCAGLARPGWRLEMVLTAAAPK
jgi:enamine deaminase RidA (YjgF/YER057c/UK114 family)